MHIFTWKLQEKTSISSRHWFRVKCLKWANFLWSRSRCVTKECFHFAFSFFRLRLYRFSKCSPSLKHQKALDLIIANLKGNWLTTEISPPRNSYSSYPSCCFLLREKGSPARIWNVDDLVTFSWFSKINNSSDSQTYGCVCGVGAHARARTTHVRLIWTALKA